MATAADEDDQGVLGPTSGQRGTDYRSESDTMVCISASELYALALICTLTLGLYYAFDIPAALPSHFLHLAGGKQTVYELLYSVYALPNTILPLIGGAIADQALGLHRTAILLTSFVVLGQLLVTLGIYLGQFSALLLGRFTMGLGGETLYSLQPALCAWWFESSHQPAAMAVALTLGGVGETINFALTPGIARAYGVAGAMWFTCVLCGASLAAALTLWRLARRNRDGACAHVHGATSERRVRLIDAAATGVSATLHASCAETRKQLGTALSSLVDAHALILFAINMGSFGSFYSFPSIGESFLHARFGEHGFSPSASTLFALYYLVPIVLAWPIGAMLGGAAPRALHCCIAASCALMTCSFLLLASTTVHPAVGVFAIAAAYTLLCSSLPTAIAARFHPKLHGQAFGVWGCAQNGATLLIPVCIGAVADHYSITESVYFLAGCTGVSAALSCALLILRSTDHALS